jgi:uncharacterized protein YjbJ (UPF0337 family)
VFTTGPPSIFSGD